MLLSVQFPLADLRPLLGDTERTGPCWAGPLREKKDFLHFFGDVRRRGKGAGIKRWADELNYASAKQAIPLPGLEQHQFGPLHAPRALLRALFCDRSGVVARVELRVSAVRRTQQPVGGPECLVLLRDFLDLPVKVAGEDPLDKSLHERGDALAGLYARATTPVKRGGGAVGTSQVHAGEPLVFVVYRADEVAELPARAERLAPNHVHGAEVAYLRYRANQRHLGVWFVNEDSTNGEQMRKLAIGLARLHAERQAMFQVQRAYRDGAISVNLELERFFTARLGLLSESKKFGIEQQAVREIVGAYETVLDEDELTLFNERASEFSAEIAEKLKRFVSEPPTTRRAGVFVTYSHADAEARSELASYLGILGNSVYWDDRRIKPGHDWLDEIRRALARTRVAILVVSVNFLNSDFVKSDELPQLIAAAKSEGAVMIPVFWGEVTRGMLQRTNPALATLQGINGPENPLNRMTPTSRERFYLELFERVDELLKIDHGPAKDQE